MKGWLRHHLLCLRELGARLAQAPMAAALNIAVVAIALALPLGAYTLLDNLRRAVDPSQTDPQLNVYLASSADKAQKPRVEAALERSALVRRVRYVPKEDALIALSGRAHFKEAIALLQHNPLPDAYVADLRPGDAPAAAALAAELERLPGVESVQLDTLWLERLNGLLGVGERLVLLLGAVLAIGLAAITSNTVRAQIASQSDEIEVSRLIGATAAYIRRPFYYQGAALGLAGGTLAVGIVAFALHLLNGQVAEVSRSYGSAFSLGLPRLADLLAVIAFSMLLGWLGAHVSVSTYLRSQAG